MFEFELGQTKKEGFLSKSSSKHMPQLGGRDESCFRRNAKLTAVVQLKYSNDQHVW